MVDAAPVLDLLHAAAPVGYEEDDTTPPDQPPEVKSIRVKSTDGVTTIDGKQYRTCERLFKVSELTLDPTNPRLYAVLMLNGVKNPTQKQLRDMLWERDSTKELYQNILQNGGLIEAPILDENNIVREGNSRITCLLQAVENGFDLFQTVRCKIIYGLDDMGWRRFLAEVHGPAKTPWDKFCQAGQVEEFFKKGLTCRQVANIMRSKTHVVNAQRMAFAATREYIKATGDPDATAKFTTFHFFFGKKYIRERLKQEPQLLDKFVEWNKSGKITDCRQVTHLPHILECPKALTVLESPGNTIKEAIKVVENEVPQTKNGQVWKTISDLTKKLVNMRPKDIKALQEEAKKQAVWNDLITAIQEVQEKVAE